jgi:hypothetical protein
VFDEKGGFAQDEYGPLMLVIGSQTSNAACQRFADRFGVQIETLIEFRETGVEVSHG